ncbi:hypothetical protein [Streptomyces tauricus]|uniref:hypothetical protein n=1 Tax=Streptomyces tauricus TaxID=68274 RepID=UPI0037F42BAE
MTGVKTVRRWIKVSVAVAAVLGLGGYAAEPYATDWLLAGSACDGALPREAVEQLTPDGAHLAGAESRHTDALGSYSCDISLAGDDGWLIEMEAYTRRDDRDRELYQTFPEQGCADTYAVPSGGERDRDRGHEDGHPRTHAHDDPPTPARKPRRRPEPPFQGDACGSLVGGRRAGGPCLGTRIAFGAYGRYGAPGALIIAVAAASPIAHPGRVASALGGRLSGPGVRRGSPPAPE